MARITETVYVVASPDGSLAEFTSIVEAERCQQAIAGSQIRTQNRGRDVPAEYAVMIDGEVISRHQTAADAGQVSRGTPGSIVTIIPIE